MFRFLVIGTDYKVCTEAELYCNRKKKHQGLMRSKSKEEKRVEKSGKRNQK